MNSYVEWLENNERYLSDAVEDLRRRLQNLASERHRTDPASPASTVPEANDRSRRGFGGRRRPVPGPLPLEPESVEQPGTPHSEQASETAEDSATDPPPLLSLAKRLHLSSFERDVLMLCAAMELDTRIGQLCADAFDSRRPFPTFALALALFPEPTWEALSPDRPLRYLRLVDVEAGSDDVVITRRLRIDERIVHYIKGLNYLDDHLSAVLKPVVPTPAGPLAQTHLPVAEAILDALRTRIDSGIPVVQLLGPSEGSKRSITAAVSAALGAQMFELPADAFPTTDNEVDVLSRLLSRESSLSPITLYMDVKDLDRSAPQFGPLRRWLASTRQLVFLDTLEPWPGLDGTTLDVAKPTPSEQRDTWREALPPGLAGQAERLSGQFNLELPVIRRIAADVWTWGSSADGGEPGSETELGPEAADRLWESCLQHARPPMDQLAQRITPLGRWNDLQLPADELSLLREIAGQVKQRSTVYDGFGFREKLNRGLGIGVLFAGQSGTGKTLAAEVLANELDLLLYRIDLSAVVSKYIGETEKNLRRLFDAADDGGAILFFDEADALFGKRSEVKDSHDRYANIEVSYLLQRMENYRGLAILATNLKGSIDNAFVRRLRFIVDFPFPAVAERKRIWRNVFPEGLDVDGLDFDRLAELTLTGGSISNVALNSAFRAAGAGASIDMATVLASARVEFRKLDLPINESDFRWTPPAIAEAVVA